MSGRRVRAPPGILELGELSPQDQLEVARVKQAIVDFVHATTDQDDPDGDFGNGCFPNTYKNVVLYTDRSVVKLRS